MILKKSLGQITATFTKAIDDLKDLQQRNSKQVEDNQNKMVVLTGQNLSLIEENGKAAKFQQNLESLLGN